MFFYGSGDVAGKFNGDIWKMNGTTCYLNHFDNLLFLSFIANNGSPIERRQAEKELEICRKKLKFLENHPKYDETLAKLEKEKKIKEWKSDRH